MVNVAAAGCPPPPPQGRHARADRKGRGEAAHRPAGPERRPGVSARPVPPATRPDRCGRPMIGRGACCFFPGPAGPYRGHPGAVHAARASGVAVVRTMSLDAMRVGHVGPPGPHHGRSKAACAAQAPAAAALGLSAAAQEGSVAGRGSWGTPSQSTTASSPATQP